MKQKWIEKGMRAVFLLAACTSIVAVGLICVFLFMNGVPAMQKIGFRNFLLGTEWSPTDVPPQFGILSMIMGSIYVTAGAVIIGVPIGIFSATYLAVYAPPRVYSIVKPAVNLLSGIPSIVYGFFGLSVIVSVVRTLFGGNGTGMLSASILLGIMILPTVIGIGESAIRAVPRAYYEGAQALGASHERSVFFVVLPAAKSGLFAAMVLGVGRAIGETMAVIMVAGNQARMPVSVLKGVRTMTANIVLEMSYAGDLHREALIATGVVLFVFILIINLSFSLLKRKK